MSNFFRSSLLASQPGHLLHVFHGISYVSTTALYVVAKLRVADVLKSRSMDYHDVAYAVKAKPEKLWKVIKYLASEGIFKVEGDEVSLTPAGHYLKYDREDSMRWCIIHWNEEVAHSMHFMLDEVTTGEEAFVSAHGKDLFSLYQERPESAEAFTKCMKSIFFTANPATMAEYDFSQHSVFLDYGGGMGAATTAVLYLYDQKARSNSKLTKAYVFDLPEVIKHGKITHPLVEYRGGSFFEPETIPTGVDVILINGVLHGELPGHVEIICDTMIQ